MLQFRQTWDNQAFFKGTDDPQLATTLAEIRETIHQIATACAPFTQQIKTAETLPKSEFDPLLEVLRSIHQTRTVVTIQLGNVRTYVSTALSVDAKDANASTLMPTIQQVGAELSQAMKPMDVFLNRVSSEFVSVLMADPILEEIGFLLTHQRQLKDQLLSVTEESLITGLSISGLHSWGNLYTELAGNLKCSIQGETMGLAKAANLLSSSQRETRIAAWQGTRNAWIAHQETAAAILNAINGWRLEETQKRATVRELHYLDKSCHQSRIDRRTLDALLETTYQQRGVGQRALKAMARVLKIPQMAPWDLQAPAPASGDTQIFSFEAAIELIADAFRQLTPEMGDFAVMMAEKGWIDGKPTPNRATGAYCTRFSDPREPRIFMSYAGTMTNVITLAHELGHAWHNWVMRDLPLMQTYYPMTLAETASIFAETLVRDALLKRAETPAQKLEILWQDAQSAAVFLLNIPARFEFEKRLVEARKQSVAIAPKLKTMMADSWQLWYEDSLSEYDDMFWATKLHFSISQLGFYNYPYLFGYLFSLGIYAQQDRYGAGFNDLYTKILRDTGTMTAEELVTHHLQQDISQPQFWEASLNIVADSVTEFEQWATA
ncbi:M3 family oligoendopeptidase [Leptolyngbya cf. ectocarpi LEGE 11479]|uniref:M3 family oligoendopeptidase n=1 Tax=Leptolyngbya cf. ectocarpi LEGE 11479 TaxID=1828722 RepID=A0A929F8W6_LEPEC|nr:M3 family oligoendopeptidase [Leptolyngbya ectocarpi]MBE9067552.1 M3 family oligoendopeptidase [Leptolyngbya cf. ectocarpi LEGE 11479]